MFPISKYVRSLNTMFSILDWLFYGKAYAEAVINDSPVFILGHPRTGTTLLHNLLVCNKIPTVLTVFPHPPFRHCIRCNARCWLWGTAGRRWTG